MQGARYDAAFAALKDGRYAESARRFQVFIEHIRTASSRRTRITGSASRTTSRRTIRSRWRRSRRCCSSYPDSQKAPDALLKIGYCQYELKQWDQAEATLNQVVQKYPDTTPRSLAQGRLRALKLEGRR